jgi:hypothetical protein
MEQTVEARMAAEVPGRPRRGVPRAARSPGVEPSDRGRVRIAVVNTDEPGVVGLNGAAETALCYG